MQDFAKLAIDLDTGSKESLFKIEGTSYLSYPYQVCLQDLDVGVFII
jgi:hypothetical protein